jgi:SAM-dependent methyltransferase
MHTTDLTISNFVPLPDRGKPNSEFEQLYADLRRKEQRMYSDEELTRLPVVTKQHPHHTEWQVRKRSCARLVHHLGKRQPLKILEIGCGNGWLSRQLSNIPGSRIIGIDVNFAELQQAARVFSHIPNLQFIYGDIRSKIFDEMEFDCIIFAACIQYFPSLQEIIACALAKLKKNGEIHILDSPFYKPAEVDAARKRTADYYHQLGFPGMSGHYFHHPVTELSIFGYETLYQPSSLQHYLLKNKNPFPWICIKGLKV